MTKVEKIVRKTLLAERVALPNWRISIKVAEVFYHQFEKLEISVFEPYESKASCIWSVVYDSFRNILYLEDANIIYDRYSDESKVYLVRWKNETIVAYDNYWDAFSKKNQLHDMLQDNNYSVICVEKEPLE